MIQIYTPKRVDRFITSGRTRPLVCSCTNELDEEVVEFVVKLFGNNEQAEKSAGIEFICSMLASHFEIETPDAAIINITKEFADLQKYSKVEGSQTIGKSIGLNFGSSFLTGYNIPPQGLKIDKSLLQSAANIFAFDAMIQNPDRTSRNPNLFIRGDKIVIFDHDISLSFLVDIFSNKEPWNLKSQTYLREHIFFQQLRGQSIIFDGFKDSLCNLTDERLEYIINLCPKEWIADIQIRVHEHFKLLRENADNFIGNIKTILQ